MRRKHTRRNRRSYGLSLADASPAIAGVTTARPCAQGAAANLSCQALKVHNVVGDSGVGRMGRRHRDERRMTPPTAAARRSELPFARAYDVILSDTGLTAAEKLVMIQACRYWPNPCVMTAATIARGCGLDGRYVRRLIKGLCQGRERREAEGMTPRKAYLQREYRHVHKSGQTTTIRQLVPLCFRPDDETAPRGARAAPLGPGGCAYEPTPNAPIGPPNRNQNRKENRKEIERDASPLPARGQASASRVVRLEEYGPNRVVLREPTEDEKRAQREAVERGLASSSPPPSTGGLFRRTRSSISRSKLPFVATPPVGSSSAAR